MIDLAGAGPHDDEILQQLERMLKSRGFRRKTESSRLLKYLVKNALAKVPLKESTILTELYHRDPGRRPKTDKTKNGDEEKKVDDSIVRVSTTNLRKALNEYNAKSTDPIRIDLPEVGYNVSFSRNPNAEIERIFQQAKDYFEKSFYGDIEVSGIYWQYLERGCALDPSHAPLRALRSLADINEMIFDGRPSHLKCAELNAQAALQSDSTLWLPHTVLAAVHCCSYEWDRAEERFTLSLKLNPLETKRSPWYLAYLVAVGKYDEAMTLARSHVLLLPHDLSAKCACAYLLYIGGAGQGAIRNVTENGYHLDYDFWPLQLISVLFRPRTVIDRMLMTPFKRDSFCAWRFKGWNTILLRWVQGCDEEAQDEYDTLMRGDHVVIWDGKAADLGIDTSEDPTVSHWELALAHIGTQNNEKALDELERAMDNHHPLTIWLHRWPFLNRVRENERFAGLLKRMNLPSHSR